MFIIVRFKCSGCKKIKFATFDFGEKGPYLRKGGGPGCSPSAIDDLLWTQIVSFMDRTPEQVANVYNSMPTREYRLFRYNCQHWAEDFHMTSLNLKV
jgi:hypothetical protein